MKLSSNYYFLFLFFVWNSCYSQNNISATKSYEILYAKNLNLVNQYTSKENDSALIFIEKCKEISNKNNYPLGLAKTIEAEAFFYEDVKNDYNKATELYLESIKICKKNKLPFTNKIYKSLGSLFHVTDNYKKAKYYYSIALDLSRKEKDTLTMVKCLVNLGSISSSENNFSKAEKFFKESLKYPSTEEIKMATYANLGNLKIRQKKYKEAIVYLNQAVKINPKDFVEDAIDVSYLLDAKKEAKDFSGLDTLLPKCIKVYKGKTDLREKTILLKSVGDVYKALGDYKNATLFKDEYIQVYDSLKAMQRDEVVYEMESKYQTQQKEAEIVVQKKDKKRLQLFFILACITIALLSFLAYQNIKQKRILKNQTKLLETAVDEKNILLKETHHRVKNSFQIVSSLLYLQSENMQDKEAALAVKEAQNRVKSMVLIHQKLYSKDQLIGIETKEYIEDLVNDIIENQTDTIPNLATTISVESCIFSIDSITPLGLIINELITNCIKHAFSTATINPKIELEFKKANEMYLLKVSDNGIGFSNKISEDSFGIKLITALAKKLKAKISFENNNGTHFVMEIHKFEQMN